MGALPVRRGEIYTDLRRGVNCWLLFVEGKLLVRARCGCLEWQIRGTEGLMGDVTFFCLEA